MTTAQRFHLIIDNPRTKHVCLWTQACRVMGWDKDDREKRLEVFSEALGRAISTSSEIGNVDDFTKVKTHLLALARPADLNAQLRQANMPRKNLLVRIGEFEPALVNHLLKQRFTFAVWLRRSHPDFTGATISKGTAKKLARNPAPDWIVQEYRDAAPFPPTLDDLDENELTQLRNTLVREGAGRRPVAAVAVESGDPDWSVT